MKSSHDEDNWTTSGSSSTQVTLEDDLPNYSFKEICVALYGFLYTKDSVCCIICRKKTCIEYPKEIVTHFNSQHSDIMNESYNHIVRLLRSKAVQVTNRKVNFNKINYRDRSAIYVICRKIVIDAMPYLITETMITLPNLEDMLEVIVKDTVENTTDELLFHCVRNMSSDVKKQLIEKVHGKKFSLQYEITEDYELLINIRFLDMNGIVEHFLSYTKLSTTATGLDIFSCVTAGLTEHRLCWENCVSLCVAEVSVMCDRIEEFYCKLNERYPTIEYTYCFTYRDEILTERMPTELESVLDSVAEMVRYMVLSRVGLNVLKSLCQIMGPFHEVLIFHTDFWTNNILLQQFYNQKDELADIFADKKPDFAALIKDKAWCSKLAYLVDIFSYLSTVLLPSSAKQDNIVWFGCQLHIAIKKILTFQNKVLNNDIEMFPRLSDIDGHDIYPLVSEHLTILQETLPRYFPTFEIRKYIWVSYPFEVCVNSESLFGDNVVTELESLQGHSYYENWFENFSLPQFWNLAKQDFPQLADTALHILLHFSSAKLLEMEHTEMLNIKFKKTSRSVDVEDELRLCLSCFTPSTDIMQLDKQTSSSNNK